MRRLRWFSNRWWAYSQGFREGLVGVAERVNTRVQHAKLLLEASRLERSLSEEFAALGRRVHELRMMRRAAAVEDTGIQTILANTERLKRNMIELDEQASRVAQNELADALLEFQQRLQEAKKVIRRWGVTSRSPCLGREIRELNWTDGVFLLCLVRHGKILSPSERIHLASGDALWVLGAVLELDALGPSVVG